MAHSSFTPFPALGILVLCAAASSAADSDDSAAAQRILNATDVRGGLVVHLGCGDGKLTAALRAGESYLVHGLDADIENVDRARRHVHAAGLYGAVSIDRFDGRRLPYVDNLVNLLVAQDRGTVTTDEMRRVLAPGGVAYIREDGQWSMTVKPTPEGLDGWTHHLYDATGIGTGNDTRVGPPRHIQWEAGPPFGRSHENMSSVSAMVSSGGRVFSIMDEGPKASIYLPSEWSLSARDAFSGVGLWKIPIRQWHARLFPLKSGPMQMPRRLVANGDRVYATLGLYAPVSQIDAASGDVLTTYEDTTRAEELLLVDGHLVVVIDEGGDPVPFGGRLPVNRPDFTAPEHTIRTVGERSIAVIDTETGETVWKKTQGSVLPLTIAADAGQVYFMRGGALCGVEINTGGKAWETTIVAKTPKVSTSGGPLVLVHRDTVYAAVA
ncbi:MAG: class I SAM-dependent methyltransferase, partial [Planctomycetes bacterium]|nr:class I SAM-dependent methyltransferase [Planctomycetota bacterium]